MAADSSTWSVEKANEQIEEIWALLRKHPAPRPSAANSDLFARVPPAVMQMPSSLPQPTRDSLLQLARQGSYTRLSLEIECDLESGWPHLRAQPGFWAPNGIVSPAYYRHLTQVITMLYVKEMFDAIVSRFTALDRTMHLVQSFQRYNRPPRNPHPNSPRSRAVKAAAEFVASFRSWGGTTLTHQWAGAGSAWTIDRMAWVSQIVTNLPPTVAAQLERANRLSTEIPKQLRHVVGALRRFFVSLDGFYSEAPRHDEFEPFGLASDPLALAISGIGGPDQEIMTPSDFGSVSGLSTPTWSTASVDPDPDNLDMSVSIMRQFMDPTYCPLLPSDVEDNGLWTWGMPPISVDALSTTLSPQTGTYSVPGLGNLDPNPGLTELLLQQASERLFDAANQPTANPLGLGTAGLLLHGPSDILSDGGWSDVQSQAGSARSGTSRRRRRQPPT